jgi:hypothetical protein
VILILAWQFLTWFPPLILSKIVSTTTVYMSRPSLNFFLSSFPSSFQLPLLSRFCQP